MQRYIMTYSRHLKKEYLIVLGFLHLMYYSRHLNKESLMFLGFLHLTYSRHLNKESVLFLGFLHLVYSKDLNKESAISGFSASMVPHWGKEKYERKKRKGGASKI